MSKNETKERKCVRDLGKPLVWQLTLRAAQVPRLCIIREYHSDYNSGYG